MAAPPHALSVAIEVPVKMWGVRVLLGALCTPAAPLGEAAAEVGLEAAIGGPIVLTAAEGFGKVLLLDARIRCVVRVLVALAIPEILHEAGRRVTDVHGHGLGGTLAHVVLRL